jgi:hypothetical protein
VNTPTSDAFSVLVGLDPLGTVSGSNAPDTADIAAEASDTAARIAQIMVHPRHGGSADFLQAPVPRAARERPRLRLGALGLMASAAIAALTMLLWASPSAGEPTGRATSVALHVSHEPGPSTLLPATVPGA